MKTIEETIDELSDHLRAAQSAQSSLTARDELVSMMREYVAQPPDGEYGRARWYWTDEKLKEVLSRCDAMEKANG